jgi:hypothetical protein
LRRSIIGDHKTIPGESAATITVDPVYNAMEARTVLNAARADYDAKFADIDFVEDPVNDGPGIRD